MFYVLILALLLSAGISHAADCDEQVLAMKTQLSLIHSNLHRLSGTRPTVPVLTGTCEQNREVLAQATYNAKVNTETILKPLRDDRPANLQCDVYIPRTERAPRFCWVKP